MRKLFFLLLLSTLLVNRASSQANTRKIQFNVDKSGLAIEGYDPVAYFISNKAIEGKTNISFVHEGITYRFSSEENRSLFKSNPANYEPQYGGWCAYAMGSKGEKVSVDPETFKIVAGKLYLFYNHFFNNTLKDWNKDEANLKAKADRTWPKFLQ